MTANWQVAGCLLQLRKQVDGMWPNRSKASDGTIGNTEHSARESDHNPDTDGYVKAMDITHDPAHGLDSRKLAEALLASRDPRLKYVISNAEIASGEKGPAPWTWRPYHGANAHRHHCHISVRSEVHLFNSEVPWRLDAVGKPDATTSPQTKHPTLRKGTSGPVVSELQRAVGAVSTDGYFGSMTEDAVKRWQKVHELVDDGVAGPATWEAIEKEKARATS